ncbi:UDP binding domain-containing protein, partial [Pseudactinotalea sp.]|uniref:UDP binding domain-containing protein n=1 Tax=Pseudactinotalea sp. TaxID=1926260 RepID=UPI003B3A7527
LRAAGATVLVHDPMYPAEELEALDLPAYPAGESVDAVILQADHPEYATFGLDDAPGTRVLVDGRGVTDPDRWPGVRRIVLGRP